MVCISLSTSALSVSPTSDAQSAAFSVVTLKAKKLLSRYLIIIIIIIIVRGDIDLVHGSLMEFTVRFGSC
jgi:hypothetical protein